MPFWKCKAVRLRLIPDDYLSWLTTTELIRAEHWKRLIAELQFRSFNVQAAS
jgi:hypothetical protein